MNALTDERPRWRHRCCTFPLRVIAVSTSLSVPRLRSGVVRNGARVPSHGREEFWLGKTRAQPSNVIRRLMFCGLRLWLRWAPRLVAQALDNAYGSLRDLDWLEAHVGERMADPKLYLRPCDRRGLWARPIFIQNLF
jgi:hypothetical protein